MINRRLIRIKSLQTFYAYTKGGIESVESAEKELQANFQKTYDLYFIMFSLVIEISDFARWKIEQGKRKLLPTEEDLNPNTKFADNKLVEQLRENKHLQDNLKRIRFSWVDDKNLIKKIYNQLIQSSQYKEFMNSQDDSYQAHKDIILYLVEEILYNCDDLYDTLEEKSIYWADSVDYVIVMTAKTLRKFTIGDDLTKKLLPKFRLEEDYVYARELLTKTILRKKHYIQTLEDHIENWEINRLATIDVLILQLALHELLYFEEIPVKVTLDEYIDIAKYYSTERSPAFINGILDKIVNKFKEEDLIKKSGRGLIEN